MIHIWHHSPDTLLVFGHKSANFRTYFKTKCVLETLQSAKPIRTTRSAVLNTRHFDRSCRNQAPGEVKLIFDHSCAFFVVIFSRHISNLNFSRDTFSNANSYFIFTSLNCPHSLLNLLTSKAVNRHISVDRVPLKLLARSESCSRSVNAPTSVSKAP
jgi:hypothetical protein